MGQTSTRLGLWEWKDTCLFIHATARRILETEFLFFVISIMFLAFVENWSKQTTFVLALESSFPQDFKQNGAITNLHRYG